MSRKGAILGVILQPWESGNAYDAAHAVRCS